MTNEKDQKQMPGVDQDVLGVRIVQKALFYDGEAEKFLILRSAEEKEDRPQHRQWFEIFGPNDIPGGHVSVDEDLDEAFNRELSEEVNVIPQTLGIIVHREILTLSEINYKLHISYHLIPYSGEITLSDEHVEYKWMSTAEIAADGEIKDWIKNAVVKAEDYVEMMQAHENTLRTLAEFDNYKKRTEERQKDFAKYASEKVIMEMLPVLDNFHAATSFVPEEQKDSPWLTGIMYIQQQMEKVFEDAGVKEIAIEIGDAFDTSKMEAISSKKSKVKSPKSGAEGEPPEELEQTDPSQLAITKIVQKGYMIGDKVMRPARVEVT